MRLNITELEYLRNQARQVFDQVRSSWVQYGKWALPHRTQWLLSQVEGERNNQHIVDPTHILALRSFVAGFLEGNTSASRSWFKTTTGNRDLDLFPKNHEWLDFFTRRCHRTLEYSNFYDAASLFYYEYGTFNTGALFIEELEVPGGQKMLHFHNLEPGSYYLLNNGYGEATIMVREFSLTVKALIDTYGRKKDGMPDWSNFSPQVRKLYEDGNYTHHVNVVNIIKENDDFDPNRPQGGENRKWVSVHYELGTEHGPYYQMGENIFAPYPSESNKGIINDEHRFLRVSYSKRKPFIVGKSQTSGNFEYGQKGPTSDAFGLIRSLNKKAISKDMALEKMVKPAVQGPASLRKSYVSTKANAYVPLDVTSASQQGLRSIHDVSGVGVQHVTADVQDLRQKVQELYYADYLMYLSQNPKTRTATEAQAVVNEQRTIIGPNLQSLNRTFNTPIVEYVMDFVLEEDEELPEIPEDIAERFIRPEFISVFAQAQRAADLPQVERYISAMLEVGNIDPRVFDKVNLDKLADLYEDRLYLPAGINREQGRVEAMRRRRQQEAQKQQQVEAMVQQAKAAKDTSSAVTNMRGQQNQGGQ